MKNNQNAQKWSEKVVTEILDYMIKDVLNAKVKYVQHKTEEEGSSIKGKFEKTSERTVSFKPVLKIDLLIACEIYNKNWFSYIRDKFAIQKQNEEGEKVENTNYNPAVLGMLDFIHMMTESNLINAALSGQVNNGIATLVMNKHGYIQKTEVKQDNKTKHEFEALEPTPEMIAAYNKANNRFNGIDN